MTVRSVRLRNNGVFVIILALAMVTAYATSAIEIDPQCATMKHRVQCTCALKNGGYVSLGRYHWHSLFAFDRINKCVLESGGEIPPANDDHKSNATAEIRTPPPPNPSVVSVTGSTTIRLQRDGGTLLVPVSINGEISLKFTVDSGASDVSIPADVVMTLIRTGTLTDVDFLDTKTYRLADGSTIPSRNFRIRSLKVGDRILENVMGSVAPVAGDLLLGRASSAGSNHGRLTISVRC